LSRMVAVIQAAAHDLARRADRWTGPRGGVDARRARGVARRPGGEAVEAVAGKERLVVIATEGRCVDARSIRQLEAWTFAAGLAEANQLHARPTISREVGTHSRRRRAGSVCNSLKPPHGTTFNAETAELAEQNRFFLRVPRVLR